MVVGHFSKDCPSGGGNACRNCGQEGHKSKECTEPRNPATIQCRNCDEMGHVSKDCPKPRDYSRVKCSNCEQSRLSRCLHSSYAVVLTGLQWVTPKRDARIPLQTWATVSVTEVMALPVQLETVDGAKVEAEAEMEVQAQVKRIGVLGQLLVELELEAGMIGALMPLQPLLLVEGTPHGSCPIQ